MKRWWRALGIVATLALLVWASVVALGSSGIGGRESGDAHGDVEGPRGGGTGRGGVAWRGDGDPAAATVEAQIVDEDGAPVAEGVVELSCLRDDEVKRIRGGLLRPSDEGWIAGPGCRGVVCAAFSHPYRVPAEPWVLRPGTTTRLVARLLPRLWGRVIDRRGDPVPAAKVAFVQVPDDPDPMAVLPVVSRATGTDADGVFSVALIERPPCGPCEESLGRCDDDRSLPVVDRFVATVRAEGHGPVDHEITLEHAQQSSADAPITITLPESRDVLSGILTDPQGLPYPRAIVLAQSQQRRHEQHNGELVGESFEIHGLGEGPYAVRAIQDGVELARMENVMPGDDIALRGDHPADGPDVVLVVQRAGVPVAGVSVEGGPFRGERTDMEGQVRAAQVLPGPLMVRLRPPGRRHVVREVEIPAESEGGPSKFVLSLDAGS